MTDIEIDKALAFAIGWSEEDMRPVPLHLQKAAPDSLWIGVGHTGAGFVWRVFSHKDWNVISPIAARYDCFPERVTVDYWCSRLGLHDSYADTPQRAIAMAVIQGAKK